MAQPLQPQVAAFTGSQLLPQRNPGLIRRIANAIFRADPSIGPQPAQQQTTESGVQADVDPRIYDRFFLSQSMRLAVYKDCDEMDEVAEEVSVALDTVSDNVTTSEDGAQRSFEIKTENEAVRKIAEQVIADARLHYQVKPLVRNTIKYGDSFSEIIVNDELKVVGLRQLRPSSMYRNQDPKGNLYLGEPQYDQEGNCLNKEMECAYEQRTEDTKSIVAAFYPYQIIHCRLNWDGFSQYGRSMLRVTRVIWRKIKMLEESLIIARASRAYLKLIHHIETSGMSAEQRKRHLKDYMDAVTQRQRIDGRREQSPWVLSDFYITDGYVSVPGGPDGVVVQPSRSRIEMIDPKNEGVSNVDDLKYLHRKYIITLRVPPAHLGFEEDVNAKATLGWQDVQYIRFVRDVQADVGLALKQVFDVALVLAGLDPNDKANEYDIEWPRLSTSDEAAAAIQSFNQAQADQIYVALDVFDDEWLQKNRMNFSDEDIQELQARIDKADAVETAQQQAQADQQHQNNLALLKAKVAASPKAIPGEPTDGQQANANGKKPLTQRDLKQETTLLSESQFLREIGIHATQRLELDLYRMTADSRSGRATMEKEMASIVAEPMSPTVNLNVNIDKGAFSVTNKIPPANPTPITVQPAQVTVESPSVSVAAPSVQVAAPSVQVAAPKVTVRNDVQTPTVNVAAPTVNVATPKADVKVTVEQAKAEPREMELIRDDRGNITGARPKRQR